MVACRVHDSSPPLLGHGVWSVMRFSSPFVASGPSPDHLVSMCTCRESRFSVDLGDRRPECGEDARGYNYEIEQHVYSFSRGAQFRRFAGLRLTVHYLRAPSSARRPHAGQGPLVRLAPLGRWWRRMPPTGRKAALLRLPLRLPSRLLLERGASSISPPLTHATDWRQRRVE